MATILVYPTKPEEERSLKAFMKALKIPFETSPYNPEFVAKIKRGDEDIIKGNTRKITLDDVWK
jgi:hypothetical protein